MPVADQIPQLMDAQYAQSPLTRLTDTEVAQFFDTGYLVVNGHFDDVDLQPAIDEIGAMIDEKARQMLAAGELSSLYAEEPFETRLAKISMETDQIARAIWNGALDGPGFFNLIRNPKLLDLAEQLCGSELIASSVYRLRPKIPNYNYGAVPWHQDSGYFEPYCDKALVLTVWLPLVDTDEENGCLRVMPNQHHGDVFRHQSAGNGSGYLEIAKDALPSDQAICCPMKKGGVLLLTNRTPHVSYENRTNHVRWSMDLRYQSASLPTNARITRLEGETVPSEELGVPIACYPPEADFLVRSRLRPHEVLTDAADFARLRRSHAGGNVTQRWPSQEWRKPGAEYSA